nr:PREDICTED: spermatogenesis-associated protein 31A6-like [Rhinolophus sinicus]
MTQSPDFHPACRNCLHELHEAQRLISLLRSHLGRHPDKGSFYQGSCQDPPGKVCKAAPEGTHRPCREPVEDAPPSMSPLASSPALTEHPLPLAFAHSPSPITSSVSVPVHSSLSALQPPEPFLPLFLPRPRVHSPSASCLPASEARPPLPTASSEPLPAESALTLPQCDLMALPVGNVPQSSSPHTPWSASPVPRPTMSGLGRTSCHISTLSWWQAAAQALCLSTATECETQQEHRSHHPQEALLGGHPSDRQVEAGSPSLFSSGDQNVLDIQVTKRIKVKLWKETEKDGSCPKQRSPDYHLNSVGNMLKSLGAEQATKIPQQPWSLKSKPEQLPGTQHLSNPKVLGDCLQQEYNQLFWGLPSLHSESLVATAWISETPSALQSPSFLFNGILNACPIQLQATASPQLSHSQALSHLDLQSQPPVPSILQFQASSLAQVQTQAHLQSSLPILSSSSPPQIGACGVSCPTAQNKTHSVMPTEIQHPERPSLQEPLESGQALSSVDKRPQEVFSTFMPHITKDNPGVSILPENFPISPELRNQLEQHIQKYLIQHHWELPRKVQESLELGQLQGKLPGRRQAQDAHGPSGPSSFTGESSKDAQKMEFQLSQDMGKEQGHILGNVPEDFSRGSEASLVTFPRADSEDSESDLMFLRSDSGSDVLRSLDKNRESLLKGHLGRKLRQISEGFIPVSVRRSWLAVNHASAKSDTHMETRSLGILKGWEPSVNTTHRVSFLNMDTRELLEAHIRRFWVRHRWGLPLKVLKFISVFKMKKAQPSPTQQFTFPFSASCVSGAHTIVKFAQFLGKAPQAHPGEKILTEASGPNLVRPLIGPSPVCEETQSVGGGTPLTDGHGPSKTSLPRQEARPPSQSLTITWQSGTVEWTERGSLKPSSSLPMARNQPNGKNGGRAPRDPCHRVTMKEMNLGSQSDSAKVASEAVEAKLSPALHPESRVILGANAPTNPQNINAHLRSLGAPGTSKSVPFPRMSVLQDPGEPCLHREVVSEYQPNMRLESENQPQDCATYKHVTPNNLASQVPHCHPQKVPTADRVASQTRCGLMEAQRGSREWQELRISKHQDFWKNWSKMIAPTYKREDGRGPNSGKHAERLKKVGTSQAKSTSPSAQVKRTIASVDRKYLHWLPKKNDGPPHSCFGSRMRTMFQKIFPHKNLKGQDALQKCTPKSATAQRQGPDKSRSIVDGETPEAQALMTAMGQILEQKMAIHHERHAKNLNQHKEECRAPVCGCFCYHRLPFYPEQGRLRSHTACSHQANSSDQSCLIRDRHVRHWQSLKSVQFHNEQMGLSHFLSLSPKKTWSPVSPCHYGPRVPGAPGHHRHCPGISHFRVGVLPGHS